MNEMRVAIIGCGRQAEKHISGLRAIPGVELVLADLDVERARAMGQAQGLQWVHTVGEIFADEGIAAVDVCTPTPTHFDLISSAVGSGKDFLCEKPLTESLDEAVRLAARVRETGTIGMVGYIYRFAPIFELGHRLFKDAAQTGESMVLGRITAAHFRLSGRGSHQLWKHMLRTGGGAVNEMLVHMVDLAIWYFGPVASARVLACDLLRPTRAINGGNPRVDAEDYVLVRLAMDSGVQVFCQADLVTPSFMQMADVQGEYGTFAGSIQPHFPSYLHLEREVAGFRAGRNDFQYGQRNLFEAQMADFIHAVRAREQPSRSTIHDSVLLIQAMNKIRAEIRP